MTAHRERLQALAGNSAPTWYSIHQPAAAAEPAVIYIYAEIGDAFFGESVSARDFVREVAGLDVDEIQLHLNSPGGDVYDAVAIVNTLRQHKARVVVTVDGIAASSASMIAVTGDELVMAPNSELMVHDAWGLVVGNAADLRGAAERLDTVCQNMASIYAAKAGGELDAWRDVMRAETWYSAEEAVTAGLADRVGTKPKADPKTKASFDLRLFAHAGRANAPAPPMPGRVLGSLDPGAEPVAPPNQSPIERSDIMSDSLITGLRERLGILADAEIDEGGLLSALDEALSERATEEAPQASATPPPGTVLVEVATLDELRANADLGVKAHLRQQADDQAALVFAAVEDGRIAPSRRDHWLASLKADPGSAQVLAELAPGTIPVKAKGYTGGVEEAPDDDRIYQAAWPTSEVN